MSDRISPVPDLPDTFAAAPDEDLDSLPWLESLQPFYIDWELIWFM